MAKLPYTITICPDQPNPKQYTAMTPKLVKAMMYGNDMTIDKYYTANKTNGWVKE